MKQHIYSFWIASSVVFICLSNIKYTYAQIVPDRTLPSNSSVSSNGNTNIIDGGTIAETNLFHSFEQFSVPAGSTAYFNNGSDTQNIISRVTGSSVSNIDGLIRANGRANLFLINPNGIIFGSNASLNVGGSFLASTASSIKFADGNQFSAIASSATPLLSVSVPIGLQFGATASKIQNQSTVMGIDPAGVEAIVGLQTQPGKTLALVGGDLLLDGGYLTAPEGRIELGSVADRSQVSLTLVKEGWALGYEGVQNFKDIYISGGDVNASGEGGGAIQVQGRRVSLTKGAQIFSFTYGLESGKTLTVKASDAVELSGTSFSSGLPSALSTITIVGKAGDINIDTKNLLVQNESAITSAAETGQGGNLNIYASDSVELINGFLDTQTLGSGKAGDLTISTGQLFLRDGAVVSASSRGQGNGGSISVNAEIVNFLGVGSTSGFSSGLFTLAAAGGQGGDITVNTLNFRVADGAIVNAFTTGTGNAGNVTVTSNAFEAVNGGQVLTSTRSSGNAGKIAIDANNSITISGSDAGFTDRIAQFGRSGIDNESAASGLFANTTQGSTGNGSGVILNTKQLNVRDGAEVNVSSLGTGNAGNLEVTANSIRVEDGGKLSAISELSSDGGNINLQNLDLLILRNNGEISTSARGVGNGGNIDIDTDNLVLAERSKIAARAVDGRGGNISITTQGLFVSPESTIDADSDRGINGIVEIRRPDVDPSAELVILPADVVDVSGLVAQGCSVGGVASGESSFAITGRGGLPPTPTEATRSESILADLGIAQESKVRSQKSKTIPTSDSRLRGSDAEDTSASARFSTAVEISNKVNPTPLVEATGWVVGSNGEVVLTASVTTDTLNIPWFRPNSCNGT